MNELGTASLRTHFPQIHLGLGRPGNQAFPLVLDVTNGFSNFKPLKITDRSARLPSNFFGALRLQPCLHPLKRSSGGPELALLPYMDRGRASR